MTNKIKGVGAAMAAVAALAIGGAAIAGAAGSSNTPSQQPPANTATPSGATARIRRPTRGPISRSAAPPSTRPAPRRSSTGGGQVTDTEVGDEESFYEVEVSRGDGTQVDVQLDGGFNVVGGEIDEE